MQATLQEKVLKLALEMVYALEVEMQAEVVTDNM